MINFRQTIVDRLRGLWPGGKPTGIGIFNLGGNRVPGAFYSQSWDYARVSASVYGNPTGYRCVEAITSNFSRPAWMLLPSDAPWPQVANEAQAIKENSLLNVLNHPNPMTSGTMFQRFIARDLEMSGRSFWLKMQGVDGWGFKGPVTGLRRLPPQRMVVVGNADDELLGFIYTDRMGRQTASLPENIVYLRYPDPERTYDGRAPALVAGLSSETDTASARFNRDLLSQDGALPGYLMVKGLTPDQFQQWKTEWEAGSIPGKTRFFNGDQAAYVKVGQTNQELTYKELREDSQDDIMRAFGVPRAVAFDVSHETYANAEREQALFMQHNILPKWVLICDELTLQLGGDAAVRVALDLAGIDELQDSRDAVVERGTKMMSFKAMTINEFRRSMGWKDVAWGDEPQAPLQPMSAVPLDPGNTQTPVDESRPGVDDTQLALPREPKVNGKKTNGETAALAVRETTQQAQVEQQLQPVFNLNFPEGFVQAPITIEAAPAPTVEVQPAQVIVQAPEINLPAPQITVEAPQVTVPPPNVTVEATQVTVQPAQVNVNPEIHVDAPRSRGVRVLYDDQGKVTGTEPR